MKFYREFKGLNRDGGYPFKMLSHTIICKRGKFQICVLSDHRNIEIRHNEFDDDDTVKLITHSKYKTWWTPKSNI